MVAAVGSDFGVCFGDDWVRYSGSGPGGLLGVDAVAENVRMLGTFWARLGARKSYNGRRHDIKNLRCRERAARDIEHLF